MSAGITQHMVDELWEARDELQDNKGTCLPLCMHSGCVVSFAVKLCLLELVTDYSRSLGTGLPLLPQPGTWG